MKLERISFAPAGRHAHVVDLTAGLTVVEARAGETAAVIETLLGALSSTENGVHVECALDGGTDLVAFRPVGASHRVIDLGSGEDVSVRHARPGGGVDLLAAWRAEGGALERELTSNGAELASPDPTEAWMNQLVALDPDRVLQAAEEEVEAEQALRRATAAARATPDDSATAARLAAARQRRARAQRRHRALRIATFIAGAVVPIATLIGFNAIGTVGGLLLLAGTLLVAAGCFVAERRLQRTVDTEDAYIRATTQREGGTAGSPPPNPTSVAPPTASGLGATPPTAPGFGPAEPAGPNGSADRLNGATPADPAAGSAAPSPPPATSSSAPTGSTRGSTGGGAAQLALSHAAARYQTANASWQSLAGNIPAPWVLEHRDRIRATAGLRAATGGLDGPPRAGEGGSRPSTALMSAITSRAGALRARTGGESLPLLLDEPLAGLDWSEKAPVLEFLGRLARHQQVVVVTADDEVLSWARLEAMTGSVGLTAGPPADDGSPTAPPGEPEGDGSAAVRPSEPAGTASRAGDGLADGPARAPADPSHQASGRGGDPAA